MWGNSSIPRKQAAWHKCISEWGKSSDRQCMTSRHAGDLDRHSTTPQISPNTRRALQTISLPLWHSFVAPHSHIVVVWNCTHSPQYVTQFIPSPHNINNYIFLEFVIINQAKLNLCCYEFAAHKPKLSDVQRYVKPFAASQWEELGTALGLADEDDGELLSKIESKRSGNEEKCFMDMVTAWLRGNGVSPKTWGTLLRCLEETEIHEAVRSIQENILKCKLEVRIISPVACFSGLLCYWIFPTLKYVYASSLSSRFPTNI